MSRRLRDVWVAGSAPQLDEKREERLHFAALAIRTQAHADREELLRWLTPGPPSNTASAVEAVYIRLAKAALAASPGAGELDQIEERLKRTVDEFYPLAEKRHNDALKDALVAAVRAGAR